jgi:cell shape-determining protein MreC
MKTQNLELEKLKAENQELKDELQLIKNKLGIK